MVLRRQSMAFRDANFVAASCASVDARVGSIRAGSMLRIKSRAVGLPEVLAVFVLRHHVFLRHYLPVLRETRRWRKGGVVASEEANSQVSIRLAQSDAAQNNYRLKL